MNSFDIITVGSALIDAFLSIHDANLHCRFDEAKCELCVKHGEKILLDRCDFVLGGNACNVAVGSARMGFKTSLCAEIGADEFSQKIINGLTLEHVDLSLLQKTHGASSSFAIGINFKGERTLFVEHVKRDHNFHFEQVEASWIFLTSLGEEWEDAYARVLSYVQNNKCKLAFNPGSHQLEKGVGSFLEVLKATDILFVNKEEGNKIARGPVASFLPASTRSSEASPSAVSSGPNSFSELPAVGSPSIDTTLRDTTKEMLVQLQQMGPKTVVITDGKNGSYSIDEKENILHLEIFESPVIERTGSGDAYTSGFLAATMEGLSIGQAMRWGTINAASVVGKVGAQAGLLTQDQVKQTLEDQPEFVAKMI